MPEPVFFYDFTSPYSYIAAHRVDDVLATAVRWQPIAFGFVLRDTGRVPWSFRDDRGPDMAECERRAEALGLPLNWPPGWPAERYSVTPLRAALVAAEHDRVREFSLAVYRRYWADSADTRDLDVSLDAAREAGLDPELVREGVTREDIKEALKQATRAAVADGLVGVPSVRVGDDWFWGDDRLEDAAAALGGEAGHAA